jgi:hypothetical protein
VSDEPARPAGPVAVAQLALVELAGGQPRQLGLEVDRPWHLLAGEMLATEADQLLGDVGAGLDARYELDRGLRFLAEVGVGHDPESSSPSTEPGQLQILLGCLCGGRDFHHGMLSMGSRQSQRVARSTPTLPIAQTPSFTSLRTLTSLLLLFFPDLNSSKDSERDSRHRHDGGCEDDRRRRVANQVAY